MPVLETARLVLRPFEEGDLGEYAGIVADPEVNRYLGSDPMDRGQAWQSMAYFLGHERLRGWSNNAVIEAATGRLLGRCGLYRPEGWPGLEVGWVLGRFAWGHGFATEAATSWRDWAFLALEAEELISVIHRENGRSMKVAERIGHSFMRDFEVRGIPCVIYGQRRPLDTGRRASP
jgi:RimJ/RimL family protein N-acetyltransferase